jgi:hypothetical protein
MPSAIRPWDLATMPMAIWVIVRTTLTPTLTQVLREAAAMRSAPGLGSGHVLAG